MIKLLIIPAAIVIFTWITLMIQILIKKLKNERARNIR